MDGHLRMTSMSYNELVSMRELSVDAYWEELRDPRRRPPNELDVPVPLWPGESRQQYEREFARWLASRRLSLDSMREDSMFERKCRREFAHTRVANTERLVREGPHHRAPFQRARPRWGSRSRSRSPSPVRHFNGVQQPQRSFTVRREDNRALAPSFERRPSLDSGRRFLGRQTGERQQHDRSYSRERPRAPPLEAPSGYTIRQHSQTSDLMSRIDSRAPSPQNARFQHGDGQRLSKSPSRSPQYMRASSPSHSDKLSLSVQVRRSASPQYSDNIRKQLLARRVVSVEAFRDEMYKLRHGFIREDDLKRPHETMVRVPVILWAGESMAQYTQKFERWLDSRNVSPASLRDFPAKERSLWHSFAYTRAGTSDFAEPARPSRRSRSPPRTIRSRSRSRSKSSSQNIRRSPEQGRPPMSKVYVEDRPIMKNSAQNGAFAMPIEDHSEQQQRPESPPSIVAPPENPRLYNNKSRRELLERRVLSLEVFHAEVTHNLGVPHTNSTGDNLLAAIPVPLHPGESMGLYDHRFWMWLGNYNETKDSLRGNPARERRFRMAFAYTRVSKLQAAAKAGCQNTGALDSHPSVETQVKIPLGVLKSARARLAMNAKRTADDNSERSGHPQPLGDEPDSKRARVDTEGQTQAHVIPKTLSGRLVTNMAQKQSSTAANLRPSPTTSGLTLASAKIMTSARPLTSAASANSGSAGSLRLSSPTAVHAPVNVRPALSFGASAPRRPTVITVKSVMSQAERSTPAASVGSTKTATTVMSNTSPSTVEVSTPLRSSAISLQKLKMKRQEKATMKAVISQLSSTPLQKIKPRPEQIVSSTDKPVDLQPVPRSLLVAGQTCASESFPNTPSPVSVVNSASSTSSASVLAESKRSSPSVNISNASQSTGMDVIQLEAADADANAAQSEPDTTPIESVEMSDSDTNEADESKEHDGDVMTLDGCCCTNCMRNWARTLTHRMDQLEQKVHDLKREVVIKTNGQPTPVTIM